MHTANIEVKNNRKSFNLQAQNAGVCPVLTPGEGLFSNRNIGQICFNIYFLFYSFVYFSIALPLRITLPFYIFCKLLLYKSRYTTGRSGTTLRFVAVDLLMFYISTEINPRTPGWSERPGPEQEPWCFCHPWGEIHTTYNKTFQPY